MDQRVVDGQAGRGPGELQSMVDETQKMLSELMFVVEVEPFVEYWTGTSTR
jgi:hypothetical protein